MNLSIKILFKRLLPLLILAVGVVGFLLLKATAPTRPVPEPTERAWLVETLAIEIDTHAPVLTLYGKVEAPDQFSAVAPTAARVEQVLVRDGDRVQTGQLLLTLDEDDFRPRVTQAQADVAELQAQIESERLRHETDRNALRRERQLLENARRALERAESLAARNLGSQAQIDEARDAVERATLTVINREQQIADHPARLASLEARLARAQAALEIAERDWRRSRVSAPFDGIVSQVHVASGDQVSSHAPLLTVYPINGLQLRAKVPNAYVPEIVRALEQGEGLKAREVDLGLELTLTQISGTGDGRGVDVIFTIDHPCEALRLGSIVRLILQRPALANTVALPYSALYGNNWIYRVDGDRLRRVSIEQVGEVEHDGEIWMLVRGKTLNPGDLVAITHLPNAIDGLKVQVTDRNATP